MHQALQERLAAHSASVAALPAFGLLGLKLDADQWWLDGGEPRFRADLAAACSRWMACLAGRHSDYEFYTAGNS